jgi:hypothetical protein
MMSPVAYEQLLAPGGKERSRPYSWFSLNISRRSALSRLLGRA